MTIDRAKRHATLTTHPLSILLFFLILAADVAGPLPRLGWIAVLWRVIHTIIRSPDASQNVIIVVTIVGPPLARLINGTVCQLTGAKRQGNQIGHVPNIIIVAS